MDLLQLSILVISGIVLCISLYYSFFKESTAAIFFIWFWLLFLILVLINSKLYAVFIGFIFALSHFFVLYCEKKDKDLEESHHKTKLVLSRYRSKIDDERKNISRILHDTVNQKLIVTKLLLKKLEDDSQETQSETIHDLLKINDEIYSECRNIISSVRVETLESLGLADAIQELIETYKKLGRDINFEFHHTNLKSLSPKVSTNIYYIVSEALLNIIKYSNANNVYIELKKLKRNRFSLYIRDDGIGFSDINYSIGLTDIKERANDINGKIKITSAKNKGVRIALYFSST